VCKKDHHEILSVTVSNDIFAAYETLQVSSSVFVKEPGEKRVKSYYIPRSAYYACIELDKLTYNLNADAAEGIFHEIFSRGQSQRRLNDYSNNSIIQPI
jgi:hypothetical protein